ncbi:MAG: LEA type 2 family protein [Thermoanaerobaculia bacterium]
MKHAACTVALAAVAALALGCNTLAALQIAEPVYHLRDVEPRVQVAIPLSASSIDLTFDVEIENPNPVGLTLDRVDFELFVNGSQILRDISSQNVRIPAEGIGQFDLRTRIDYDDARNLFNELANIIRGERAQYEIRGTAFYDTPIGRLEFPLTLYRSGS